MLVGAGFILRNSLFQILLVCDARSNRWGFPKGHPERCDNGQPLNTAIREVWEETGLKALEHYTIDSTKPRRIGKRLYYSGVSDAISFEGATAEATEISDVRWWSISDLLANEENLNSDLRCWIKKTRYRSPTFGYIRSPGFGSAAAAAAAVAMSVSHISI